MVIAFSNIFHIFLGFTLLFCNLEFEVINMPLPFGHSAIGFATHSIISRENNSLKKWQVAILIIVLSNLPDIDVLFGLILQSNGSAFHRGPTHSILFAFITGFIASKSSKIWPNVPTLTFKTCFMLILSHVIADYFLTDSAVSFYWPLEVSWSTGTSNWSQVLHTVIYDTVDDSEILLICTCIIIIVTITKKIDFMGKLKFLPLTVSRRQTGEDKK